MLNPRIGELPPSAFMILDEMIAGLTPAAGLEPLNLTIGEPQNPPPDFVTDVIAEHKALFSRYTATNGTPDYRRAVADWLTSHYGLPEGMIDADRNVLPVAGLREGMFMIAQIVTPETKAGAVPTILMPNPFYHPYAGAALAAHAEPVFVPALPENRFMPDYAGLDEAILARAAVVYLCSPANPQGTAADMDYLMAMIKLARAHDFLLIVDECYAEVYTGARPTGALEAAARLGGGLDNLVVFHSLSKRSNAPGLRSGFAAGDAEVLQLYFKFRNYGAVAVSMPILAAAAALLREPSHVAEIRDFYRVNFDAAERILGNRYGYYRPDGGFFLWLDVGDGIAATRKLWTEAALKVVPGAFMTRQAPGSAAAGDRYIRLALVHDLDSTVAALNRLTETLG
jgi:aspartate/methionine/tyrosine aminotransferase